MSSRQLDYLLAFYSAPALAGIKPANLFSVRGEDAGAVGTLFREYNRRLNARGISLMILCEYGSYFLVLVYRPSRLWRELREEERRRFLAERGYLDWNGLDAVLGRLSERCRECRIPHEIGVFLGYPLEDVAGFIENKGRRCKLCGYWKVYSDEASARECFERFTRCRNDLCRRVRGGESILRMFGPV